MRFLHLTLSLTLAFVAMDGLGEALAVQWQTPKRLTNDSGFSGYPAIARSGDSLAVAWHDNRQVEAEIHTILSDDLGATWGAETRLTNSPGDSRFPEMTSSANGQFNLVFQDNRANVKGQQYDIYYTSSADGGKTWATERPLSQNAGRSIRPVISASGENLYLAWADITGGMFDLYFRRSENNGQTWSSARQITSKPASLDPDSGLPQQPPSVFPRLDAMGTQVALAWFDCRHDREPLREPFPDNYEIYMQYSNDSGLTWGEAKRLSNDAGESTNPDVMCMDHNEPLVLWSDAMDNDKRDIMTSRARVDDATKPGFVSKAPKQSMQPRVVRNGSKIGAFGHDNRDEENVTWQIYFAESTDGGVTWSGAAKLTDAPRFAGFCDVVSDGRAYYVVYQDDRFSSHNKRENNFEVFFLKGE